MKSPKSQTPVGKIPTQSGCDCSKIHTERVFEVTLDRTEFKTYRVLAKTELEAETLVKNQILPWLPRGWDINVFKTKAKG